MRQTYSIARFLVFAALMSTLTEGAFRKWVPGFSSSVGKAIAYFSKDIFLMFGTLLFFKSRTALRPTRLNPWFILASGFIASGIALSAASGWSNLGAVLTFWNLVLLPALALIIAQCGKGFPIPHLATLVIVLSVGNMLLGLYQNAMPEDHWINQYANDSDTIVSVEAGVRATGTFAYITGLTVLSSLAIWAGLACLSVGTGHLRKAFGVCGIVSGIGCGFAAVSRSAVVIACGMLLVWAISSRRSLRLTLLALAYVIPLAIALFLAFPHRSIQYTRLAAASVDRFSSADDDNSTRAVGQLSELAEAIARHPAGTGFGTEQVAGNFLNSGVTGFTTYESQFPRLIAEVGIFGFIGFVCLMFGALTVLQGLKRRVTDADQICVLTATQLFMATVGYVNLVFNHTAASVVWIVFAAVVGGIEVPSTPDSELPVEDYSSQAHSPVPLK